MFHLAFQAGGPSVSGMIKLSCWAMVGRIVTCAALMALPGGAHAGEGFQSTAVVEVAESVASEANTWVDVELEVIHSDQTLWAAAKALDLPRKWQVDEQAALERVRTSVSARQVGKTRRLEITVRSTDAKEARALSSAVAKAYAERRQKIELARAEMAMKALDAELAEQERLVAEKRKALDELVKKLGIEFQEKAGKGDGVEASVSEDYVEARRGVVSGRAMLEGMEVQHAKKTARLKLPKKPVSIVEKPATVEELPRE